MVFCGCEELSYVVVAAVVVFVVVVVGVNVVHVAVQLVVPMEQFSRHLNFHHGNEDDRPSAVARPEYCVVAGAGAAGGAAVGVRCGLSNWKKKKRASVENVY